VSYDKGARTAFANRAFVLSEMFNAKFRNTRFSGAVGRIVKVIPPETESTGGGKMARESIALVPESEGASGSSIVCGWLDVGQNSAELRSYSVLSDRHKERFGNLAFDLEKAEYETFVAEAQQFLAAEGIALSIISESTSPAVEAPARPSNSGGMQVVSANASGRGIEGTASGGSRPGMGLMLGAAILLGVGIGVAVMLILK
jgi:hypothetical protein